MKGNRVVLILMWFLFLGFKNGALAKGFIKPVGRQPVSSYFTAQNFNDFFPLRNPFYSYNAFMSAIEEMKAIEVKVERRGAYVYKLTRINRKTGQSKVISKDRDWDTAASRKLLYSTYTIMYADFCAEKDLKTNKKELAAFLAQIAHETRGGENGRYNDGLMYLHEIDSSLNYVAKSDTYAPAKGKKYYGRGPIQLSYNSNYGYASACILGDKKILLNDPDLVIKNSIIAFETAIYFWMTPQLPKPSAHAVMTGDWKPTVADRAKGRLPGFGMTINVINGEVECNKGDDNLSMNDRIGYYQYFLKQMGAEDLNAKCSCGLMQPYE